MKLPIIRYMWLLHSVLDIFHYFNLALLSRIILHCLVPLVVLDFKVWILLWLSPMMIILTRVLDLSGGVQQLRVTDLLNSLLFCIWFLLLALFVTFETVIRYETLDFNFLLLNVLLGWLFDFDLLSRFVSWVFPLTDRLQISSPFLPTSLWFVSHHLAILLLWY